MNTQLNRFTSLATQFKLLGTMLASTAGPAALSDRQISQQPHAEVEASLPAEKPRACYRYAERLFDERRLEDGLMWFEIGLLREYILSAANSQAPWDGPTIGLATFVQSCYRSNPQAEIDAIDRTLEWDARTPNPRVDRVKLPEARAKILAVTQERRRKLVAELEKRKSGTK